jgi:hypothetical protein
MKARLHAQGCVANPRHSSRYGFGLRLALSVNPSLSLRSDTSAPEY